MAQELSGPGGKPPLTLLLPGKLVIAGGDRRGSYFLRIFDLERNRLLREQTGVGSVYQLYSRTNILFMKMSSSGAGSPSFTLAQSLTSRLSATVPGWLVAEGVRGCSSTAPTRCTTLTNPRGCVITVSIW